MKKNKIYAKTGIANKYSVTDYLNSQGKDSSFASRGKLFSKLFSEKYEGTAEQNLNLLGRLKKTPLKAVAEASATVGASAQSPIESGVIVDKRSGKAYIMKGGQPVSSMNVLTGENVEGNKNNVPLKTMKENSMFKNTPVGSYKMVPKNDIYGLPGMALQPIEAFGQEAPQASGIAMHRTYPGDAERRNKLYGSTTPYGSYGCVNMPDGSIKCVNHTFPEGDTSVVIDSKMPQYKALANSLKASKKAAGGATEDDPIDISFTPPNISDEEIELERRRLLAEERASALPAGPVSNPLYPQKRQVEGYDFTPPFQIANALALGVTAFSNKLKDVRNDKRIRQFQIDSLQNRTYSNADEAGRNHDPIYYKAGGKPSKTIEAEEGEILQTNNGLITKVPEGAGTHEEGGVDVENVHRVLEDTSDKRKDKNSKLLKLPPETVESLTGFKPKTSVSHSKAHEKAVEFYGKKAEAITKKLVNNAETRQENDNDPYALNSMKFNMMNLGNLPPEEEIFNTLFNHQEMVKSLFGIADDGKTKKLGGYVTKAQTGTGGPWTTWGGDKLPTFKKKFGVSNAADKLPNLDEVARQLNYNGPKDPVAFQKWLYASSPENAAIIDKWHKKYEDPSIAVPLSDRNRFDGKIGIRWQSAINEILGTESSPDRRIDVIENMPTSTPLNPAEPISPSTPLAPAPPFTPQPRNNFNEPLKWYDVAGDLSDWASTREEHVNYNPAEIQQIRLHRQNPLPALQQGQSDYNQMISALASSGVNGGVQLGNTANIYNRKYAVTNQTLGQTENINSSIADKEAMYNADAKDRQSIADQQAREVFERKVLGTREAVRQQKTIARNNLLKTVALNKKFNKEGNLLLKLFPAFDQTGEYNGYKYNFRNPVATSGAPNNTFDNFLIQNNINPASLTPSQKSNLVLKYLKQTK